MEEEKLRKYLSSPYTNSKDFVNNIILPIFGPDNFEDGFGKDYFLDHPEDLAFARESGIKSVKIVGNILVNGDDLYIYDIAVSNRIVMERNRKGIQKLVRRALLTYSMAFMIFHYEDDETLWDWRFSFCYKGKNNEESTDGKRYTFLLGPRQSCRTAAHNFSELSRHHEDMSVDVIENAFSVEALSNEFFKKYKGFYEKFVSYVTGKAYVKSGNKYVEKVVNPDNDKALYAAFGNNDKSVRDYVKRMLGRIVFLHFLQKKGWMGVPAGKDWGEGDRNFLLHLFENTTDEQKGDFLDAVLEPLFSEGLDTDRSAAGDLFDTGVDGFRNIRIPYLNGGLFERDCLDEIPSRFPKEYFHDILEMLSEYNFTIDENDPNDAEVGVDPEMLGRIFENLLEDNKDKGAYYTPKEVVQYMCRESLTAYLQAGYSGEDADHIREFVRTHEPDSVVNIKADILQKLKDVKVCDPAIGSGAFPMGMLREIFLSRSALEDINDPAEIKRQIIQNNIYGVDIEKGAVEIARLRFWLALIVDEKTPETLPNLDFKIMEGNSLLESYKGIDLSKLSTMSDVQIYEPQRNIFGEIENPQMKINFAKTDELQAFHKNLEAYFNTSDHSKKALLRCKIERNFHDMLRTAVERFEEGAETELRMSSLSKTPSDKQLKAIAQTEEKIEEYRQILRDIPNVKITNAGFFLWHTWFKDVFLRPGKEGFDIVIGNPPYIQLQNNGGALAKLYEDQKFESFTRTGDIYCLFYERGCQLLRDNGYLCYITSNKWMRAGYGEKIRKFFAEKTDPVELIDFAGLKIFDTATVDTNILLLSKSENKYHTLCATTNTGDKNCIRNLSLFVQQQGCHNSFSGSDSWVILSPIEQSIKKKIEAAGTPLSEWDIQINYGIKTGCNEAFIVSTEKRNEILSNCQSDEERRRTEDLIRPILRGRDIKRYRYDWAGLWLIATFPSRNYNIEDYPAVRNYLFSFGKERLEQTGKAYFINGEKVKARKKTNNKWFETQDNISYWEDFYKPKIFYADITQKLNFCLCKEVMFCNNTTYFITAKDEQVLDHLYTYLNLPIYDWYYRTLSVQLGEKAVRMFSIYVLNIPIPPLGTKPDIEKVFHLTKSEMDYLESKGK